MKVKALKFTKNHGIHGSGRFSWKTANFAENVRAVKSWIRLVPTDRLLFRRERRSCVRSWPSCEHSGTCCGNDVNISFRSSRSSDTLTQVSTHVFSSVLWRGWSGDRNGIGTVTNRPTPGFLANTTAPPQAVRAYSSGCSLGGPLTSATSNALTLLVGW